MRVKLTSSSSDATDVPDIVSAFLERCLALETMSKAARRNIIRPLTVNDCVQHDVKIKLRNPAKYERTSACKGMFLKMSFTS